MTKAAIYTGSKKQAQELSKMSDAATAQKLNGTWAVVLEGSDAQVHNAAADIKKYVWNTTGKDLNVSVLAR